MTHTFPYSEFAPIDVPDGNLAGVYTLESREQTESDETIVRGALEGPIGSPRLRDMVEPDMRIAVAVDDNTRSTKTELMLPLVLEELAQAGVSDGNIAIVIAIGTHRSMTEKEITEKYGEAVASRYRVVNPNWRDTEAYVDVGQSQQDITVRVHREIVEADFVVGVGQTIPHMIAGFGGGAKIINPGCSDGETI